jgi:hypothetical protein
MRGFSTVAPVIWTPKFEKYEDVDLPSLASYIPASPGIYSGVTDSGTSSIIFFEIYSSVLGGWYPYGVGYMWSGTGNAVPVQICDGANARYRNSSTLARRLILMRVG